MQKGGGVSDGGVELERGRGLGNEGAWLKEKRRELPERGRGIRRGAGRLRGRGLRERGRGLGNEEAWLKEKMHYLPERGRGI